MRHVAIVGSGPAGYYTAETLQKYPDICVDVLDRLPVPYGLIRSGVAPDHQSIKGVSRRYEGVALTDNVRFVGHVAIGSDVTIEELTQLYDAVVLATGAPQDRPLPIAGADLQGVIGSAAFVGWYNGHPDHSKLSPPLDAKSAVIIGNGNVALDVARILAKTNAEFDGSDIVPHARAALIHSQITDIHILGRRGPHQIHMSPKELGELVHLSRAAIHVDPQQLPPINEDASLDTRQRKAVTHLRNFAATPASGDVRIHFDFYTKPIAIESNGDGRAARVIVERTRLNADLHSEGTGESYALDAGLVITCIGYQTPPIPGVPYEEERGRFASEDGRILPGLYCVGWARRGPSGTIGTNKPDGARIAEMLLSDIGEGSAKAGRDGLDQLLADRGIQPVTFQDWRRIDAAEVAAALDGAPRQKFTSVEAMLAAIGR
jgi:NADPH-dependent glutamate synthase beta subunit-like oxidoreductase